MVGTRGVPAKYGGFETAVEEVGSRLVGLGHDVVVYCRGDDRAADHLGMRRVRLPALRHPVMETLSHTALSVGHLLFHRTDVALVFNAANAPLLPVIRARPHPGGGARRRAGVAARPSGARTVAATTSPTSGCRCCWPTR